MMYNFLSRKTMFFWPYAEKVLTLQHASRRRHVSRRNDLLDCDVRHVASYC